MLPKEGTYSLACRKKKPGDFIPRVKPQVIWIGLKASVESVDETVPKSV